MSIYLANYWSLYRKFIEVFKNLKYREIPLTLLTNFYQQIDEELKTKMENEDFRTTVLLPEMKQEEIQPYFEGWLGKIRAPLLNESKGGITLVNNDYTRIPEITYLKWFDPHQTIILSRSKSSLMYGMPNECILNYEETNKEKAESLVKSAESLVKSAKFIFSKLIDHPAFSNEYFQKTFLARIPLMVKTINSVYNLLDKHNISAIIVGTTEDMLSRTLAIIGSIKGIKSICLQHGILMGEEAFLPVFTSMVGVYGEYEKRWYLQRGLAFDRIAEIGHPKYDHIFTYSPCKKEVFLRKYGLAATKLTLLVITGPNLDLIKFKQLISTIAVNPSFQLIIKPHPWEIGKRKYEVYLELEKQFKSIKVLTSRENNLYDLISHSDGVVSTLSTVVSESILFNKPVFIYNFLIGNRTYDYYDSLEEFSQKDPAMLFNIINKYYSSSEQKEIYDNLRSAYLLECYNDGSSGEKLIHIIKQASK